MPGAKLSTHLLDGLHNSWWKQNPEVKKTIYIIWEAVKKKKMVVETKLPRFNSQWGQPLCDVISSVQSLSRVWFFATPWTAACQASLSISMSQSLFKLMSNEPVMPPNHLALCCLKNWCLQTMVLEKTPESPLVNKRSNQSILREINPESLEGLMLKLKLLYFGYLMQTADSLEKSLMLGKIEGKGEEGIRWWDGWMLLDMNLGKLREKRDRQAWCAGVHQVTKSRTWLGNWTTATTEKLRILSKD